MNMKGDWLSRTLYILSETFLGATIVIKKRIYEAEMSDGEKS